MPQRNSQPLNDQDKTLVSTVYAKLTILGEDTTKPLDEARVRRLVAELRSVLVDRQYPRAWELVGFGKEPTVLAKELRRRQ